MNRRSFLSGIITAPVVILTPDILMPIKTWAEKPGYTLSWFEKRGNSGIWTRHFKWIPSPSQISWPIEEANVQRQFIQLEENLNFGNFENQILDSRFQKSEL